MAVPVGGYRTGPLYPIGPDTSLAALSLRNRMDEEVTLLSGDVQFAYPLSFGDTLQNMLNEMTDTPLLLRTQKVDPTDDRYDPLTPTYFLTDQVGVPVSGYTIDQDNGWIYFDPSVGNAGGIWHARNEADQPYYFGRRFKLNAVPGTATIDVTTSDGFSVWVNNQLVVTRSTGTTLDDLDIQPFLKTGENQVVVETRRPTADAGDVQVTDAVVSGIDLATAAGNWSASRYSVLGVAGIVDFKAYEGGAIQKRADRMQRARAVLDSLTALLRAEGQQFDTLISLVR